MLYIALLKHDLASEKERYSYIAKNEAEHVVTTIDCVMARTNTLKALIQDHNGDTSFFNHVADDIYKAIIEETGVTPKNLAIAPDGIVSDVYPIAGNEALIGFNFLDTSMAGNLDAKEAYERGYTKLTNPFKLIQGGNGMGCRSPVLLRNGGGRMMLDLSKYEALISPKKLCMEVYVVEAGTEQESNVDQSMKLISLSDAINLVKQDNFFYFVIYDFGNMSAVIPYLEKELPGRVVIR